MPNKFVRRPDGSVGSIPHDIVVSIVVSIAGAQIDGNFWTADADYEIAQIKEVHSVAGAGSTTLDIKKCTGTTAPASGTTVLSSTFAIDSTANTVVSKTAASGLSTTRSERRLASGDRLATDWTGTVTAYVGCFNVYLRRIQSANANY